MEYSKPKIVELGKAVDLVQSGGRTQFDGACTRANC